MASIRWYLQSGVGPNGWVNIVTTAQGALTMSAGWVVGTGSTFSSEFSSAGDRASTTFIANTVPDGTLDAALNDALRTDVPITGTFAAANWTFQFAVQSTVQSGAAGGQIVFRVIKANGDGTGATEITSAQQSASVCTLIGTTDVNGTLTVALPAITLTNQYLFIQIAWKRTVAGGMTTTNVRLRTGVSATVGTTILSSNFTPGDQAVTGATIPSGSVTAMGVLTCAAWNATGPSYSFGGASALLGQSISGHAGPLTFVSLWIEKSNSIGTDTLNIELHQDTYTGALVATSQNVVDANIPLVGAGTWVVFTFSSPPVLSAGTTYFFKLFRPVNTSGLLLIYQNPDNSQYLGGSSVDRTTGAALAYDQKFQLGLPALALTVTGGSTGGLTRLTTTGKQRSGPAASLALTLSPAPAVGSGVLLIINGYDPAGKTWGANDCADNFGNPYSLVGTRRITANGEYAVAIYYCARIVTTGTPFTITATGVSGNYFVGCADEIGGLSGKALTLMSYATNSAATSTTPTTNATTSLTGETLVAAGLVRFQTGTSIVVESVSPTWTEEFEELDGTNWIAGEGDSRILTLSAATTQANWTIAAAGNYAAIVAAFQAATAAQAVTNGTITSGSVVRIPTVINSQPIAGATRASTAQLFAASVALTVIGATIASASVVRIPTVANTQLVTGATIASASIRYAPTITPPPFSITGATIVAGSVGYAPSLTLLGGTQTILGATISGAADLLLEDGGYVLLEDGVSRFLLEESAGVARVFAPTIDQFVVSQSITTGFIASGSVTRAPSLAPGPVTILGSTIASGSVVRVPSIAPGPVTVLGATRASTAQIFQPSIAVGPVTIVGSTISSGSVTFAPSVLPGAVTVLGVTIGSTVQTFVLSVTTGPVSVIGATRLSTAQIFDPSIAVGPVTILGATRPSTVSLFAPSVTQNVVGAFIGSSASVLPPSVTQNVVGATRPNTLQVFAPSVAPGAVTILGATISSASSVFAPSVSPGPVTIVGVTRPSTLVLFAPSIAVGPVAVTAAFLTSTAQLYPPTLTAIAVGSIGAAHIASTVALYPPTVTLAIFVVTGGTIAPTSTLYAPTVAYTVVGASISSIAVLRAPSVQPGPVTILGATISSTINVFPPSLGAGATTIVGGTVASTVSLYPPTVLPPIATIVGARISSSVQLIAPSVTTTTFVVGVGRPTTLVLFPPSVAYAITGATIPAGSVTRAPSVAPGAVTIVGGTITSTVQLRPPSVTTLTFVTAGTIGSIVQVFAPIVTPGIVTIGGATLLSDAQVFPPITVTPGPVTVVGATRGSTVVLFPPSLLVDARVVGGTVPSTVLLLAPSIVRSDLTTGFIDSTNLLFGPEISTGDVGVTVGGLGSTSKVYPPALLKVFPPGTCLASKTVVQYLVTSASVDCMMGAVSAGVTVRYLGAGVGVTPVTPVTASVNVRYLATSDGVHVCCLETIP